MRLDVPAFSSRGFREEREESWQQLETLVQRIEKRSVRALSDDELLALPILYRSTLSSLSIARETSLDAQLIDYLEALCTRAYFVVYGARQSLHARIWRFFVRDWPDAIRDLAKETLVALALTLAGAITAYLLVLHGPQWFYAIIPGDLAGGRDPSASKEALRAALYSAQDGKSGLSIFATFLFTHNAQIAILAFALGFALCVPTALLLLYNGCMVGAFLALYAAKGLGFELGGWLLIHGTTELFAIILAGAAGLRIGQRIAFPGGASRSAAAAQAGRTAAIAMVGVVVMLMIAGALEGIGRQTINNDAARYAVAGAMLALWLLYFYAPRRIHRG